MKRIGIKEKASACGLKTHRISFFNSRTNKKQKFGISTNPELTTTVIRQEFLSGLSDLLKFTKIHRENYVKLITANANKVYLICEKKDGEIENYEFDLLIAADRISSVVRKEFSKIKTTYICKDLLACTC